LDRENQKVRVIAIDGPAGAGKSSVAIQVARELELPYLDTGAMYRAVALKALRKGLKPPLPPSFSGAELAMETVEVIRMELGAEGMRVWLGDEEVSSLIRSPECSEMASVISALPEVRKILVRAQRRMGEDRGGVMEGRDIGTVVFPDAMLKIFLTASARERALRRLKQRRESLKPEELERILREQEKRDHRDSTREDSPLRQAEDAFLVDTSELGLEEVVARIVGLFRELE